LAEFSHKPKHKNDYSPLLKQPLADLHQHSEPNSENKFADKMLERKI